MSKLDIRNFVIDSLSGFYSRLPLKKISVNGEEVIPNKDGVANVEIADAVLGQGYGTCYSDSTQDMTACIDGYEPNKNSFLAVKFNHDVPGGANLKILSNGTFSNTAKYTTRLTGGSSSNLINDSEACISIINGNSTAWNQLVSDSNIVFSVQYTTSGQAAVIPGRYSLINGHNYLVEIIEANNIDKIRFRDTTAGIDPLWNASNTFIFTANTSTENTTYVQVLGAVLGTVSGKINIFDLTLIFGAGNEPSTVEEFEAWLSNNIGQRDYYPHDQGSLLNVGNYNNGIESVGFNQWDEEWETGIYGNTGGTKADYTNSIRSKNFIPCLPNTQYYAKGSDLRILYYDENFNYLGQTDGFKSGSNFSFYTTTNTFYITIYQINNSTSTYNNNICINISDDNLNGIYKPYKKSVSNFDVTKIYGKLNGEGDYVQVFPGGLKSADYSGIVKDTIDYVENKAIKRVESVDLGSMTWSYRENKFFSTNISDIKESPLAHVIPNIITSKYNTITWSQLYSQNKSGISLLNTAIRILDVNYDNADTLKASLQGVLMNYELATPLTYTNLIYRENNVDTPLTLPSYSVEKGGIERQLISQGNKGEVSGVSGEFTVVYQKEDSTAISLPIKKNGLPIELGEINSGDIALFYCDLESYSLVNVYSNYKLVNQINANSTDSQYPSAKAIYDSWKNGQVLFSREYLKSEGNQFGPITSAQNADAWLGSYYFMDLVPTSEEWTDMWWVSYRMYIYGDKSITNGKLIHGIYDCYICMASTTLVYKMFNNIGNTDYYPIYTHPFLYYDTAAKYANRMEHPIQIGIRITSCAAATTACREARIEILGYGGCDVRLKDPVLYEDVWNSEHYNGRSTINATSQGLQESGDLNDTSSVYLPNTHLQAGERGMMVYSLVMQDGSGKWQSFTTTSGTVVSKEKNPTGFKLGSPIFYMYMSSNIAANGYNGNSIVAKNIALSNFAYSTNCGYTTNTSSTSHQPDVSKRLTGRLPLYIVGTLHNDGLFYLDDVWWTQVIPTTEDGKIYIKVCESVYNEAYSYRGDLVSDGKAYWYKNGRFQEYVDTAVCIGTSAGTNEKPIYIDNNGVPTAITNLRSPGNNIYVGSESESQCHLQYDDSEKCLKFIFD